MNIRIDEWLKELEKLSELKSDEGMTAEEIAEAKNWSKYRVYKILHSGLKEGKVVDGGKRIISRMGDGNKQKVPVYQFVGKGKK